MRIAWGTRRCTLTVQNVEHYMRKFMAITSRSKGAGSGDFVPVDWFQLNTQANVLKHTSPNQTSGDFLNYLWPAGAAYYSPLNSVMLSLIDSPDQLAWHDVWMARDGLVPLLWFFKKNPNPGRFSGKILIHESFAPFVPAPWRPRMGTFSIQFNDETAVKVTRKNIMLTGMVTDTFSTIKELKAELEVISRRLTDLKITTGSIYCLFINKNFGFGNDHKYDYLCDYMFSLSKQFKNFDLIPINWSQFEGFQNLNDFYFADLSGTKLCADSYFAHSVLKRGARPLAENRAKGDKKGEKFVRLSQYHGVVVKGGIDGEYALYDAQEVKSRSQSFKLFEEAMRSEANVVLPWPSWIKEWAPVAAPEKDLSRMKAAFLDN